MSKVSKEEKKQEEIEIRDVEDTGAIARKAAKKHYHIFVGSDPRLKVTRVPFDIPLLDKVLGGGLPLGRTVLTVGNFGAGKTFFAQTCMANFQRKGYTVAYVDTERRFEPEWFRKSGVDTDKLLVAQPISGENALDMCAFFVAEKIGLVVLDSVAALVPMAELEGGMEDSTVASIARLFNKGLRKITELNIADEDLLYKGTSFLVINQMRSGIGPYTSYGLPGGQGQQFFSSIILRIMRGSYLEDADKKKIGFNMKFYTEKNNIAEPLQECSLPFYFSGMIDTVGGLVELALDLGIVKQNGAFFFYDEDKKIQGKQAFIENLRKDTKLFEIIQKRIYDAQ